MAKRILGFSPEEAREKLGKMQADGTARVNDRIKLIEDWIMNIERRLRSIEKSLKMEYPEDLPKE
jgi:hypothetical protein